jgi:predicted phage terminase large subunit-like protein
MMPEDAPRMGIDPTIIDPDAWRINLAAYASRLSLGTWKGYRHLRYLANRIQTSIAKGGARIIVNMPPQHGKTELLGMYLPGWFLSMDPSKRVLICGYQETIASRNTYKLREQVRLAGADVAGFHLSKGKDRADDWDVVHPGGPTFRAGSFAAAGVGGAVTGRPADLAIIDDPHKGWEDVQSEAYQTALREWWNRVLVPRLQLRASVVVVMTRWAENDLTGWLLKEKAAENWEHIIIPAIWDEDTPDPMGRVKEEVLCPELHSREEIYALKNPDGGVGTGVFETMYQQRPQSGTLGVFRRIWFSRFYDVRPDLSEMAEVVGTWDFSHGSKTAHSSWCAGQVWARRGREKWLLDEIRRKMTFTEMLRATLEMCERWPSIRKVLIENKASGPDVIDMLEQTLKSCRVEVVPVDPGRNDKYTRARAATPGVEAGEVILPSETLCPWVKDWLDEVCGFPFKEAKDRVDAFSQILRWFDANAGRPSVLHLGRLGDYMKERQRAIDAANAGGGGEVPPGGAATPPVVVVDGGARNPVGALPGGVLTVPNPRAPATGGKRGTPPPRRW